ncbi:hypothetical protein ACOMHN_027788 [Nucella lapillus]
MPSVMGCHRQGSTCPLSWGVTDRGQHALCHGESLTDRGQHALCHGVSQTDRGQHALCHGVSQTGVNMLSVMGCHRQGSTCPLSWGVTGRGQHALCHGVSQTGVNMPSVMECL